MDPLWIGAISLAILIVALVLAYLLFYKEQSFEDAVASQKASTDMLIQKQQSSGKASLKHRKKPKKERTKSDGESEKINKQNEAQLEVSEESDPQTLSKSLADEAANLFEEIPEKPILAESSEEDKPAPKPKKKARDKRKSDQTRGASRSKEQEREPVREEVLVQESFAKTEAEEVLEGLPPMVEEESLIQPKEESIPPATGSGKKPKKSKAPKDKQSTTGICVNVFMIAFIT